jgi:very-short-patch-repair endonuclease
MQKIATRISALDSAPTIWTGLAAAAYSGLSPPPAPTRSELEARLLELVRRCGLPEPEVNVRLAGFEVDLLWRAERLVVEADGMEFHASRAAMERDRRRDAVLASRGVRVLRVTWTQVTRRPLEVEHALRGALS